MRQREQPEQAERSTRGQRVVARAAATANIDAGRFGSGAERASRRRFLSIVALVIVAGTLLVGYTWAERQYHHPTTLDSWQNAYGVYDCTVDGWLEPFESRANPDGIRSRGDGVIYIEPATDAVAGDNATLQVFLNAMDAELTDDRLVLADGTVLAEQGATCDGEPAVLQIHRWEPGTAEPIEVRTSDLAGTRFLADGQALAIALAPEGTAIPLPPAAAGTE